MNLDKIYANFFPAKVKVNLPAMGTDTNTTGLANNSVVLNDGVMLSTQNNIIKVLHELLTIVQNVKTDKLNLPENIRHDIDKVLLQAYGQTSDLNNGLTGLVENKRSAVFSLKNMQQFINETVIFMKSADLSLFPEKLELFKSIWQHFNEQIAVDSQLYQIITQWADGRLDEKNTAYLLSVFQDFEDSLSPEQKKALASSAELIEHNQNDQPFLFSSNSNMALLQSIYSKLKTIGYGKYMTESLEDLQKTVVLLNNIAESLSKEFHEAVPTARQLLVQYTFILNYEDNRHYPVYLSVYNDRQASTTEESTLNKELWLRCTIMTEFMGFMDLTFHLYQGENLDIIINSTAINENENNELANELRENLQNNPLQLRSITIN